MWYELAPAIGLTTFFFALSQVLVPAGHYVLHGVPHIRQMNQEQYEMEHWKRDQMLSYKKNADGHRTVYLEGLPDRNQSTKKM